MALNAVFIIFGFIGAITAFGAYAFNKSWHKYALGRFLVAQAGFITFIYIESIFAAVLHLRPPVWLSTIINGIAACIMIWHAIVFLRMEKLRRWRQRDLKEKKRNERTDK